MSDKSFEFECPACKGQFFGLSMGTETYRCHDEFGVRCQWKGLREECEVVFRSLDDPTSLEGKLRASYRRLMRECERLTNLIDDMRSKP